MPESRPTLDYLLDKERAVEERLVPRVQGTAQLVERTQPVRHGFGPVTLGERVPVRQTGAASAGADDLLEQPVIVRRRDVFEDIAQVKFAEFSLRIFREEILQRCETPLEPVEVPANERHIFLTQIEG